jgi:circadian clock protein KaiC
VESKGVRRLVIDALGDMQDAAIEGERFRAACWTLMHYLGNAGVTSFFLSETPWNDLESVPILSAVTRGDISYMSDNVILMRYLWPPHGETDRALQVLKTRSTGHDPSLRPFRIGPAGLVVAPASEAVWPVPPAAPPAAHARSAS